MKFDYIHYFLELCHYKSISQTAKHLFISQQALSSAMKRLEDELNVPLFIRSTGGVSLTPFGDCFYQHAKKIQAQWEKTQIDLSELKRTAKQTLSIATSFGVLSSLPENYFQNFETKYPNIQLIINECDDMTCENLIATHQNDIGFNILPIYNPDLAYKTVLENDTCLLLPTSHPLAQSKAIPLKDLKDTPFLLLTDKFKIRHNFMNLCKELNFKPKIALETMEMSLLHHFSRLNRGVGLGVHFIGMDIVDIAAIPYEPSFTWQVAVIWNKTIEPTSAVKDFLHYIDQNPIIQPVYG